MSTNLVYFSSISGNTHRFVEKLGMPAARIPLYAREPALQVTEPYVLVLPTYGGGEVGGAVPKQVIRFLNDVPSKPSRLWDTCRPPWSSQMTSTGPVSARTRSRNWPLASPRLS